MLFQGVVGGAFEAGGAEVGGDEVALDVDSPADKSGIVHKVECIPDCTLR